MWVTQTLGEVFYLVWPSSLTEVIALRLNVIEEKPWKLNTSIGPSWIVTQCCTELLYRQHPYQVPMTHSTVRHKIFCTLRFDFTQTIPPLLSTSPWPHFTPIYVAECPSQVTREGSDTQEYSFVLGYPISDCSDGFQLKRPGAGAGCLWSTLRNRGGHDALVTQECGYCKGQWGFPPCGHIWAVMSVEGNDCKFEHKKVRIPIKFY